VSDPATPDFVEADDPPHYVYAGVRLAALGPRAAADRLHGLAEQRRRAGVHLCNAYTLSLARRDSAYRSSLAAPALNLVDGTPVTWFGSRLTGDRVPPAVRGPSLMRTLMARSGLKHYLLGGSPESLARLERAIGEEHPDAVVAGSWSPPFRPLTDQDRSFIVRDIRESGANIVWVGLGTPKQDELIADLYLEVDAPMVAIGAAFDFLAGTKPEAPQWLQNTGLEWVFRLMQEPRRLWRRYLVGNAGFMLGALSDIVRSRRTSA
jgi:N-acetylglucosaminyldiphosphoundecaprenol N-acetyl-beta-D-mannosaminyltransferase